MFLENALRSYIDIFLVTLPFVFQRLLHRWQEALPWRVSVRFSLEAWKKISVIFDQKNGVEYYLAGGSTSAAVAPISPSAISRRRSAVWRRRQEA